MGGYEIENTEPKQKLTGLVLCFFKPKLQCGFGFACNENKPN